MKIDLNRKRHTDLPPLPEDKGCHIPEISYGAPPNPSFDRYRLTEDGWVADPDFDSPQEETVPFDVIYDGTRFWFLNPFGVWRDCNTEQIKLSLVDRHKLWRGRLDDALNDAERVLNFIVAHNRVTAVYSMAGFTPGIYCTAPGTLVLVPTGMHLIQPGAGDCPETLKVLKGMFEMSEEPFQLQAVLSMWKLWYISLRDRTGAPGQAQVFIGPKNTGKTFIQEQVITAILGGREAEPYAYLSGDTRFCDDVMEAEHLKCSDAGSRNADTRQIIASKLKELLYNTVRRAEGKNAKAVSVAGSSRLTISVNTDPEDLKMLPLSTDSIRDKMATFWVKNPGCFPAFEDRAKYLAIIRSERPAFIQYLLDFPIPKELQRTEEAQRCGVDTYRSSQAEEILKPLGPEESFWETLCSVFSKPATSLAGVGHSPNSPISGTASDVYSAMLRHNKEVTRSCVSRAQTAGTYLTRIAAKKDGRVTKTIQHDHKTTYELLWK
jgi:hypothetical protein